jgi:hypothetical protein
MPSHIHQNFVVVDTSGIHLIDLQFCGCYSSIGASHPRSQLLRVGWLPATIERPSTAFTFDILNSFHLLTLQGKTSAFHFYWSVSHKTDNIGISGQKVCRYIYFIIIAIAADLILGPLRSIPLRYADLASSEDAQTSWTRS